MIRKRARRHTHAAAATGQAEGQLASVLLATRDGVIGLDRDARITLFNAAAERMFGWTADQIRGRSVARLIPRRFWRAHRAHLAAFGEGKTPARPMGRGETVYGLRADGTEFPIEASIARTAPEGRPIFAVVVRDLTERQQHLESLHQSEQALRAFFSDSPLGLMWVGPDGKVTRANRAQLDLLDRSADEVLGHHPGQFYVEPAIDAVIREALNRGETVRNHRVRIRAKDGSIRYALVDANSLWRDGRLVHTQWFMRDISDRVRLERENLTIAEQERERIGHDLHDELCQQLTALEFMVETAAARWSSADRPAARAARAISRGLRRANEHARELARGLAVGVLSSAQGLETALRDLADRTRRTHHCACRLARAPAVRIEDQAVRIQLYRIAREAVANALKHARPHRIDLQLRARNGQIVLQVNDDGVGLPRRRRGQGMGLHIMQSRAVAIDGKLTVRRRPGGGTAVTCTMKDLRREGARPSP